MEAGERAGLVIVKAAGKKPRRGPRGAQESVTRKHSSHR